jgi:hypothetical protein
MIVSASVLAFLATFVGLAGAQESKSARGTVTAIAGDSVTVKAGTQELKFTVDAKTTVVVEGGGTADRAAAAKGTGPKLAELLKVGEAVEVSYRESAGVLLATNVRRVSSAGASGGGASDQTIAGSGSGGTKFTQTYTIDANTKVVGEGVGTAASKGKVTITDLVKKGDPVTVTYTASGSTVRATEVRVRRPQ